MFQDTSFSFDFEQPINTGISAPAGVSGESKFLNSAFISEIKSRGTVVERKTALGDLIDVYRNLNKPEFFSCRQVRGTMKGKVSGYAKVIIIEFPLIRISEASRQRVIRESRKNAHSFLRGSLLEAFDGSFTPSDKHTCISYNPYKAGHFFYRETGEAVLQENIQRYAIFNGSNVYLTDEI